MSSAASWRPAGLTTLSVNDQTVTADASGNFTAHVAVTGDGTAVRVAALDRHGEKAVLDFMLLPAPGGVRERRQRNCARKSSNTLPRGVQLGKYYALVIGNDNYQAYPALKSAVADATTVAGAAEVALRLRNAPADQCKSVRNVVCTQ